MEMNLQRWCRPETILVATNLHESPSVMLHAIHQARFAGARVILAHVIHPACLRTGLHTDATSVLPCSAVQRAKAMLDEMALQFQSAGVLCEPLLLDGNIPEQIRSTAISRCVDRVIVAADRTIGIERLLTRSLAETLACTLDVPLCIIGPEAVSRTGLAGHLRHILVAISNDSQDAQCASLSIALARYHGASLTMLYVSEGNGFRRPPVHELPETLGGGFPLPDLDRGPVTVITRTGDIALSILTAAMREIPDLIVLEAPPDSVITRLLGTSGMHRVLQEAKCPVMTIKQPAPRMATIQAPSPNFAAGDHQIQPTATLQSESE